MIGEPSPFALRPSTGLYPVLCRPAGADDTPDVLRLVSRIWGGEDYVPAVWGMWLSDERGVLAVAEHKGRVVGFGHLSDLGMGEAWLEGLRVDPEAQGTGVGSHLHDYLLTRWLELGQSVVRLVTHADRVQVHAMCARTGLVCVADVQFHRAWAAKGTHAFRASPADEAGAWRAMAVAGTQRYSNQIFDLGWEFAELKPERLVQPGGSRLWRWGEGRGWLVARPPRPGGDTEFTIGAACADDLAALLRETRVLAESLGATEIHWLAPVEPGVLEALNAAGYRSEIASDRFKVFERRRTDQAG